MLTTILGVHTSARMDQLHPTKGRELGHMKMGTKYHQRSQKYN